MLKQKPMTLSASIAAAVVVAATIGCGGASDRPKLGRVSGVVTLDGRPIEEARLTFRHENGGRASKGLTDSSGAYVMYYDIKPGVAVGMNQVKITTYQSGIGGPGRAEEFPKKYNTQSELVREVKRGRQTIDFELEDVPGEKKPQPVRRSGLEDDD